VIRNSIFDRLAASAPGRLPRSAGLIALAGVCALLFLNVGVRAADSAAATEYKVKGAYLFNFARYVEWLDSALPQADSPFIIAVLDGGDAAPVLEQLFAGRKLDGRPVQVRSVAGGPMPRDAHILLVTRTANRTPEEIRAALGTAPTLLVGETEQFAERGGMIGFVHENDSVRLTLCLEHTAAAALKISAKLATVAKSVKPRSPAP
jgi:hypothetical protein